MKQSSNFKSSINIFLLTLLASWMIGCTQVHQKDREYLSDKIMQRIPDPQGSGMEGHNFPRREGAAGGTAGSGGGCGC